MNEDDLKLRKLNISIMIFINMANGALWFKAFFLPDATHDLVFCWIPLFCWILIICKYL